jgi:hypothetical protein
MKPRRGTKPNPFVIGERIVIVGGYNQADIEGEVVEVKDTEQQYWVENTFIKYLVVYTINDKEKKEWMPARHLRALE